MRRESYANGPGPSPASVELIARCETQNATAPATQKQLGSEDVRMQLQQVEYLRDPRPKWVSAILQQD